MTRKLVTIRTVHKLESIPGADFIECATVDGWELVVKKGEFKVGDSGVYFEIDSMLPEDDRYAFLKRVSRSSGGIGYRIKTIRLRKQISQGLLLPLEMFPEVDNNPTVRTGDDLSKLLNVWLYEPIYSAAGAGSNKEQASLWPDFLRKTDQERIQNKIRYFDTYCCHEFEVTKKLDGSSMTIWHNSKAPNLKRPPKGLWNMIKYKFNLWAFGAETRGVCSRNVNLKDRTGNAFWDMAHQLDVWNELSDYNVALQGELVGPNIQKNHEKVLNNEFYLFDIFDIDRQEYMLPSERIAFLTTTGLIKKIRHAPRCGNVHIFRECTNVAELQEYVTGESMNPGTISEGMVFKSTVDKSLSFKCISNKYLLKCEE